MHASNHRDDGDNLVLTDAVLHLMRPKEFEAEDQTKPAIASANRKRFTIVPRFALGAFL